MNDSIDFALSAEQQRYLLAVARKAIAERLEIDAPALVHPREAIEYACGAFVTLRKGGALRGCIGTMSSEEPLPVLIERMAISSAFEDPRFPPLSAKELPGAEIELSLLSPLKRVSSGAEVIPGEHGVLIRGRLRSGVLLPQVATEYGWDRDTFLEHVCLKAGLPKRAYLDSDVELFVFSAVLCSEASE